jgi:hypothetical protein
MKDLKIATLLFIILIMTVGISVSTYMQEDAEQTAQGAIDNRSLSEPARNAIFSCIFDNMGNALGQPWVDANGVIYFADKPVVEGSVSWNSRLEITVEDTDTVIEGNGLPDHPTGEYPIAQNSDAYQYDRNPNSIAEQSIQYVIPTNPTIADQPTCLPGGTIGVALTGGVIFNALDADARDAVANEIFDECEGHPQQQGQYHYHHASPCFPQGEEGEHSPLVGYALDGFGIYGAQDENGEIITNDELDECHGHFGPVPTDDGGTVEVYHYHLNEEFPYTLGCFTGEVDQSLFRMGRINNGGAPLGGQNGDNQPPQGQNPPRGGQGAGQNPPPPPPGG